MGCEALEPAAREGWGYSAVGLGTVPMTVERYPNGLPPNRYANVESSRAVAAVAPQVDARLRHQ